MSRSVLCHRSTVLFALIVIVFIIFYDYYYQYVRAYWHPVEQIRPIAVMHGFMSSAAEIAPLVDSIRKRFPGAYVIALRGCEHEDTLLPIHDQAIRFRQEVEANSRLNTPIGFNVVAHSLGGVIARVYVQERNVPRINRLICIHSPMTGIGQSERLEQYLTAHMNARLPIDAFGLDWGNIIWSSTRRAISWISDDDKSHHLMGQIQQYLDYAHYASKTLMPVILDLQTGSEFMTSLNKGSGLDDLEMLVLIQARHDEVIVPSASSHFGSFKVSNANQQPFFSSIGLEKLYRRGGLLYVVHDTRHRVQTILKAPSVWERETLLLLRDVVLLDRKNEL